MCSSDLLALPPEQAHEATLKALEAGIYPRPSAPDEIAAAPATTATSVDTQQPDANALVIATPEHNMHVWRNPEQPAALNRLALKLAGGASVRVKRALVKKHEPRQHHGFRFVQQVSHRAHGDGGRLVNRISESAGGNGREADALAAQAIGLAH